MFLILKCDLIHPYLDKSKTRILGRREYFMNINATFQEGIFASVTCFMDIASNPSALMPLKTCSSVFVHSFLCVYVVMEYNIENHLIFLNRGSNKICFLFELEPGPRWR